MHKIDIQQLEFIDERLRKIMAQIEKRCGSQIITSLYRMNEEGVHGTLPLRGIDLRCKNQRTDGLDDNVLVHFVNRNWIYDPERPNMKVAIIHDVGQGRHIHLQTHPNTNER